MENNIEVYFPKGKRVDAKINGMVIPTDQIKVRGGDESAPEPFQLFLASIATCAGIFALNFCNSRKLSTEGMGLTMGCEYNEKKYRYEKLTIELKLPVGFPVKYKEAIERAMDLCAVKKHILDPPEFIITSR